MEKAEKPSSDSHTCSVHCGSYVSTSSTWCTLVQIHTIKCTNVVKFIPFLILPNFFHKVSRIRITETQSVGHWSKPFHFGHQKLDAQTLLGSLHSWLKRNSNLSTSTHCPCAQSRRHMQTTATFQYCVNLFSGKNHLLKSHFCVLTQQVPGKLSMKLNTICELCYYLWNKLKSLNIF